MTNEELLQGFESDNQPITEKEIVTFLYNNTSKFHSEYYDACEEIASVLLENFELKRKK